MFLLTQFDARTRHDQDSLAATALLEAAPVSPLRHRPATYKDAQIAGAHPAFKPGDVKGLRQVILGQDRAVMSHHWG